jgi:WD40 repeat protein
MWRFLGLLAIVLGIAGVILWYAGLIPIGDASTARIKNGESAPGLRNTVDSPISLAAEGKSGLTADAATPRHAPITITDAVLKNVHETEISSRIDGKIEEMLVELNQRVSPRDLLARLDDALALQAEAIAETEIKYSGEKAKGVKLHHEALEKICTSDALSGAAVAQQDKLIRIAQRDKALSDYYVAQDEKKLAEQKLSKAKLDTMYHRIFSNREGKVARIYNDRKPGEAVRAGEPLFKIVNDDILRADGAVDAHLASYVHEGMRALVEPEIPLGPSSSLRSHTGAITDLAVTSDGRILASASKDHDVILWSLGRTVRKLATLSHAPDEVYAIASGAVQEGSQGERTYTILAGCGHGRAVLWRVTTDRSGKVLEQKSNELIEKKNGRSTEGARLPVRCAAFSANGKYAATGGEDYQVRLWNVETGELLYRVKEKPDEGDKAHRGAVTTVHFMPDGHLLTAGSSDRVWRKWMLGLDRAELKSVKKDRAGDVARLGMTPDGRRVLYDYGEELRIYDPTQDWAELGSLQQQRQGRFQNLAVFSPSGHLVLTVGAGRLQLWAVPAAPDTTEFFRSGFEAGFGPHILHTLAASASLALGGDPAHVLTAAGGPQLWPIGAYELRQLITADAGKVTSAAFSAPVETAGGRTTPRSYAFVGSEDGTIQIYELPPPEERRQPIEAVITFVGTQVERGGAGLIPIRAEFANPTDPARRLTAGGRVNLTVYPETWRK